MTYAYGRSTCCTVHFTRGIWTSYIATSSNENQSVGPVSAVNSHSYCAKKFHFLRTYIYSFYLTDIFIIAIVAAVKLISEGEKFLRGRRPVSSESSPDGGLVVTGTTKPPNEFFNFRVPMKLTPSNIYLICNTF